MPDLDATCLFCRVVAGETPAAIVERDDLYVAFRDIAPQAPEHILVTPQRHTAAVSLLAAEPAGALLSAAARIGARLGPCGFRLVINEGVQGGQSVDHVHIHILAGRMLTWPPG